MTALSEPPRVFRIDVENRSHTWAVVSITTDIAGAMPGFLPGERGTILIPIGAPLNGVGIEVLGPPSCGYLDTGMFPSTNPFTLFLDDRRGQTGAVLTVRPVVSAKPIPLPRNALHCPAG